MPESLTAQPDPTSKEHDMPINFTPTAQDMEAIHYGVAVTSDEDGEMLALGHIDERRALAAFNRHARTEFGWPNVADDRDALLDDWAGAVRHGWLVFHRGEPNGDWEWQGESATAATPGAVAVTLLDVN